MALKIKKLTDKNTDYTENKKIPEPLLNYCVDRRKYEFVRLHRWAYLAPSLQTNRRVTLYYNGLPPVRLELACSSQRATRQLRTFL